MHKSTLCTVLVSCNCFSERAEVHICLSVGAISSSAKCYMVSSQSRVSLMHKVKGNGKNETHKDLIGELEKRG